MSKTVNALSPEQSFKLVDYFEQRKNSTRGNLHADRNLVICLLLLDAGLRVGELVHLRVADVWFEMAPVNVLELRPETTKTNTGRQVPVSQRARTALIKYKESPWHWIFKRPDLNLFRNASELKTITTRQVERIIGSAGKASLGIRVHPHMLRHTFATRLMQKSNIRVVQALLGHSSLQSTQIYTHPNNQDLQKAIEAME